MGIADEVTGEVQPVFRMRANLEGKALWPPLLAWLRGYSPRMPSWPSTSQ